MSKKHGPPVDPSPNPVDPGATCQIPMDMAPTPGQTMALPVESPSQDLTRAIPVTLLTEDQSVPGVPIADLAPAAESSLGDDGRTVAIPLLKDAAPYATIPMSTPPPLVTVAQKRKRGLLWVVVAAACVLLGVGGWFLLTGRADTSTQEPAQSEMPSEDTLTQAMPAPEAKIPPAARPYVERIAQHPDDTTSLYMLATMYLQGINVPKDEAEGLKWLRKAADAGHEGAKKQIREMEGR